MDVRTLGLTACAIAALAIVARILWFFTNRTPVLAHSENVDALGETLPDDPLNPPEHREGLEALSPLHITDMRVEYEVGGEHYEHDIAAKRIGPFELTDDMPILWADPENPVHVEAYGPRYWVLALVAVGGVAAAIYQFAA